MDRLTALKKVEQRWDGPIPAGAVEILIAQPEPVGTWQMCETCHGTGGQYDVKGQRHNCQECGGYAGRIVETLPPECPYGAAWRLLA